LKTAIDYENNLTFYVAIVIFYLCWSHGVK